MGVVCTGDAETEDWTATQRHVTGTQQSHGLHTLVLLCCCYYCYVVLLLLLLCCCYCCVVVIVIVVCCGVVGVAAEEGQEKLLDLHPYDVKRLLHLIFSRKEFTVFESEGLWGWGREGRGGDSEGRGREGIQKGGEGRGFRTISCVCVTLRRITEITLPFPPNSPTFTLSSSHHPTHTPFHPDTPTFTPSPSHLPSPPPSEPGLHAGGRPEVLHARQADLHQAAGQEGG